MILPVLIPARGGSKGVPGKNIIDVCGFPLLSYSIMACQKCGKFGKIFVSTDDEKTAQVAAFYGVTVIERPAALATDLSTDYDVLSHFFSVFPYYEQVAYIRPTTPNRLPEVLSKAVDFYFANKFCCTGMRSMHELSEPPYKMFKISDDGFCRGFFDDYNGIKDYTNLPRQNFPKAYMPNGYIDIVKRETVKAGLDFGDWILPFITNEVRELDSFDDLCFIEAQMGNNSTNLWCELNDKYKK